MKRHSLYVIMICVVLHNFCIRTNDPCNPRYILPVKELELNKQPRQPTSYGNTQQLFSKQTICLVANFFMFYSCCCKLFYVFLMLWFNPVIPYVFEWFFLLYEVQQTLLVI